jgi:archaemetzincin
VALALLLAASHVLAASTPASGRSERVKVFLVALGDFPAPLVDEVAGALRAEYGVEVERLPPRVLPASAYYSPRRRYRAEKLLDFLRASIPGTAGAKARILGLTAVDISTTKDRNVDWGVFGLGDIGGRAAVTSSFRLRRNARDPTQVVSRVRSTAVHEVGHTLGLDHCDEPRCVMLDAEGSIRNTDSGTGHLGAKCRRKLAAH